MKTKKWRLTYALIMCYAKLKKIRKSETKDVRLHLKKLNKISIN